MIPEAAIEEAAQTIRLAAWGHISAEDAARKILEAAANDMTATRPGIGG